MFGISSNRQKSKKLKRLSGLLKYGSITFSQEGEDILLARFLGAKSRGFYVDVGAHHPSRFSNTRYFYERGWSGINIDPLPGVMELFCKERPRDVSIEAAVAEESGSMLYYIFNEPALNTFCESEAKKKDGLRGEYWITEKRDVQVKRLDTLLSDVLENGQKIDFMTVDAEGLDLEVLKSNDWEFFRPSFVLAETLNNSILKLDQDPVVEFMKSKGFDPVAKTLNTVFFKDSRLG
jgi:FkbM family methyltransferase